MFSAICYLLDYRLLMWRRSGKDVDGDRVWKNLRRFSSWMCAGSLAGVATFALLMQSRNFEINTPGISRRRFYQIQTTSYQCLAAFSVFYPVHLLCSIFAMNTLLRRVSDHASHSYYNTARDDVGVSRSSTVKRFDWRDCVGEYAISLFLQCQTVTL